MWHATCLKRRRCNDASSPGQAPGLACTGLCSMFQTAMAFRLATTTPSVDLPFIFPCSGWPARIGPSATPSPRHVCFCIGVAAMKKAQLVMVGNGMAGVRTLEELLKIAPDLYDITVFGAEPHPNYNRILLSPVLAGEQTLDEIVLNDWAWYRDNGITLHAGYKVTEVDRVRRCVHATGPEWRAGFHRVRPPDHGHRLQPVHPAHSGQGPARRAGLPRHCRHPGHDRRRCKVQECRGDRWRPARPRSRQRPHEAWHERERGARGALADGAPAGRRCGPDAAEVAGGAWHAVPDWGANAGAGGRCGRTRAVGPLQGRQRSACRPGGDGRRHPPQHRAGRAHAPACEQGHRGERHAADRDRPAHLCGGRMRGAPRHCLRSGGAPVRTGPRGCHPPGRVRHWPLHRLAHLHQAQGHRHRPVLMLATSWAHHRGARRTRAPKKS
jgi:hypothetical protein